MAAMPQARILVKADRSRSVAVVRHADEVAYVERFKSTLDAVTKGTCRRLRAPVS